MSRSQPLRLWVAALSIRRWRAQFTLFVMVLAVAVTSGTVLAGSLLLVHSTEDAGIRAAVTSITDERVDVDIRIVNPNSPVSATRSAIDQATVQAYGTGVSWTSRGWTTTDWVKTPAGVHSYLVELDDPSAAATIVDGQWPTSPRGIAVPEQAARSLGVAVGDTVVFDDGGTAVELRVEALYRPLPESGVFWDNDPLHAAGDIVDFPEPDKSFYNPIHAVGPLIASQGGVDASGISTSQLEAVEHPSFGQVDVTGLASLTDQAAEAETAIARAVPHSGGPLYVNTAITDALGDVAAGLAATRERSLIITLVLLVVVAVAMSAVTRLFVDSRSAEFQVLSARGASRRQIGLSAGLDALVVGGVVALVSPWGGVLLRAGLVELPPLTAVRLDQWILPDESAWLSSAAVGIIVAGLLCLPPTERRAGLGTVPPRVLALAATTAVVVAAGLLVWRATTTNPAPGDLLLAATPAVLLVALVLLGSRLATAVTRPIAVVGGRARGVVVPLAGWFAARGPGRVAGVALVALSVGASLVVLGMGATWQQAIREEAATAVGPSYRVSAVSDTPTGPEARSFEGGAGVIRRQSVLARQTVEGIDSEAPGRSVQVLGLNAAARRFLTAGPGAAAGGSDVAAQLPAADPDDTGPALPSGTHSLQATVTVSAPEGAQAVVSVVCEDESGSLAVYPLGPVTPGVATVVSTGAIARTDGSMITRLVGVTARVQSTDDSVALDHPIPFVLTMSAVTASVGSDTEPGTPLTLLDGQGWSGSVSGNDDSPPEVVVTDSAISITAKNPIGPGLTTYGAVGWNPYAPIGAVLPSSLADDLDATDDSPLTGFVGGARVTFTMVGDTAAVPGAAGLDDLRALEAGLPTASTATATIAVDGPALVHFLVQSSAPGPLVDEFWFGAEALPHSSGGTIGADLVVDSSALGQRMVEAPLRAAISASEAVAVAGSLLLALAGFGARSAAVSRSRRLEAAQLRAVGLSRRGMLGVVSIDTVAIATAGIAIGLISGLSTLGLLGTRIASGGEAKARAVVLPWESSVLVPLALLGLLGMVSLGLAIGQRRLPLSELLRTGADG